MFYYDPDFGYIWITAEKFGGHVLIGRGPVIPHDPDSIEEQRYSANDKLRWREVDEIPDEWRDAFGLAYPESTGLESVYDITVAPPQLKTWQIVFAAFVWLIYWVLWNSNK
jgi:hypothetical protein